MNLEEQINQDIKEAMKAREQGVLEALRAVKSAILMAKTEKGASETLGPDAELKILQRLQKQRKEAAEIYAGQSRTDLADVELFQAGVIARYLPEPLDGAGLEAELRALIAEHGFSGPSDLGKLMGVASKSIGSRTDGKSLSEAAKKLLG